MYKTISDTVSIKPTLALVKCLQLLIDRYLMYFVMEL